MQFNILIIDDEETQANDIERNINSYLPVCTKLFGKEILFTIDKVVGRNAFDDAMKKLDLDNKYHLVLSDEQLHTKSGFNLLKSIDSDIYSSYKVLFSKHDYGAIKVNEDKNIKWVRSKRIIDLYLILIDFEMNEVLKKCFGNLKYFDLFYKCSKQSNRDEKMALVDIENQFTFLKGTLSPSIYTGILDDESILNQYRQKIEGLSSINIKVREKFTQSFIAYDRNADKSLVDAKLNTLSLHEFILTTTDSKSSDKKNERNFLYYHKNGDLEDDYLPRVLTAIKKSIKDLNSPVQFLYITKPYVYNLLWVYPVLYNSSKVEVISTKSKREFIEIPELVSISKAFETFKNIFFGH